jgi:uncharacterized protein YdhG (YjbR/CyaY superfamily)
MNTTHIDIDGYLAGVPDGARAALESIRRTIKAAVPEAVESISYGIPTFKYRGRALAYFGAWKKHCSLYGFDLTGFEAELAPFDVEKGTIRFQPDRPLPADLVRRLVEARKASIEAARKTQGRLRGAS